MARLTYLERRVGTYYARIDIPVDLVAHYGTTTRKKSLRTKDENEAKRLLWPVIQAWQAEFDDIRSRREITDDDKAGAVWQHYSDALDRDDQRRTLLPGSLEIQEASRQAITQAQRDRIDTTDPLKVLEATLEVHAMQRANNLDADLRRAKLPAQWANASDLARETYWNRAAALRGGIPFSFHFSHEEEEKVRACPNAVDRIRRALSYRLKPLLGCPDLWFRLEATHGTHGALHGHGAIVVPADNALRAKVRKGIRQAAGEWDEARQFQVKFEDRRLDDGWATYAGKHIPFNREDGIFHRAGFRRYQGKPSYCSEGLKAEAKALYLADKEAFPSRH